jgi:hypothetical protein
MNNSAGAPSNINEELINEQGQYISELESIVITVAESLEVSVEDLMEALNEAKQNTSFSDASAKRKAEQAARQATISAKNKERLANRAAETKAKYFPKYTKPEKNSNSARSGKGNSNEVAKPSSSGLMQFGSSKSKKPKGAKAPKSAPTAAPEDTSSVKLTRVKQVDVPTKPVTDKDWAMSSVTHRNGILQKPSDGREHLVPITQAHHEAYHALQTLRDRARANPNNPEHQRRTFRVDTSIIDRSKVTPENPRGDNSWSGHRATDAKWGETKQEWIEAEDNLKSHDNRRERALRDATQRQYDGATKHQHRDMAYPSRYDLESYLGKVDHPLRRDNTPKMREEFGKFHSADHGTLTPHVSHVDQLQTHVDSLPAHVRAAREAHPEARDIMREKARLARGPRDYNDIPATDHPRDGWIRARHADQYARNQRDYLDLFREERPKHRQH